MAMFNGLMGDLYHDTGTQSLVYSYIVRLEGWWSDWGNTCSKVFPF